MPVDMSRYPPNWPEIRSAVLERAGHRCEACGKPNHQRVYVIMPGGYWYDQSTPSGDWSDTDTPGTWRNERGEALTPEETNRLWSHPDELMAGYRMYQIKVVLTTAHLLSPDPLDCDIEGLASLCQYHHLKIDAKLHARNAAITRRRRLIERGQLELF
jgi:hypothetical protein